MSDFTIELSEEDWHQVLLVATVGANHLEFDAEKPEKAKEYRSILRDIALQMNDEMDREP